MRDTLADLRRRRVVALRATGSTLVIAVGLTVSGCADAPARQSPESVLASRTAPAMLDLGDRRLPIERYLLTDRQLAESNRARIALAADCVARYGLTLPRLAFDNGLSPTLNTSSSANTAHRYGIIDAAVAARFGYHRPPGTPTSPPRQPGPKLSTAVDLVLAGESSDTPKPSGTPAAGSGSTPGARNTVTYRGRPVPEGGCLAEAVRQLGARSGTLGDAQLANEVNLESISRTQAEPATEKAIRAWSACMRAAGFDYADPLQTPGPRLGGTPQATPEEIAVATSDVACKRRTNLVGYWFTAEQAYQELAIREHSAEFEQIRQEQQVTTTRAKAVLAGNRSTPPT